MITAKNYAAQAEQGLIKFAEMIEYKKYDAECALWMARAIKNSQHFAVEDNGIMFNDGLKGIKGIDIRLPYPSITIEYYRRTPEDDGKEFDKYIVLAQELTSESLYDLIGVDYRHKNSHAIAVHFAVNSEELKCWMPAVGMMYLPSSWDDQDLSSGDVEPYDPLPIEQGDRHFNVVASSMPFLHDTCHDMLKDRSMEEIRRLIGYEVLGEVKVVLELCEALTCSNVKISEYSPAAHNNIKRVRQGKLPVYETKCLTIDTSSKSSLSSVGGELSDRNSPRQHLRRGHIRRLPDRNIWVNSCVVGSPDVGVINKQYRVKHSDNRASG